MLEAISTPTGLRPKSIWNKQATDLVSVPFHSGPTPPPHAIQCSEVLCVGRSRREHAQKHAWDLFGTSRPPKPGKNVTFCHTLSACNLSWVQVSGTPLGPTPNTPRHRPGFWESSAVALPLTACTMQHMTLAFRYTWRGAGAAPEAGRASVCTLILDRKSFRTPF